MPYYKITQKQLEAANRLVKTKNAAAALKHLTEKLFTIETADMDTVATLIVAGVKVEEAQ